MTMRNAAPQRLLSRSDVLAWLDQAIVSGMSFAMLIFVGRWSGAADLGSFALGMSAYVLAAAAQEALITRPYAIALSRAGAAAAQDPAATAVLAALWSALVVVAVAAAGVAMTLLGMTPQVMLWVLAAILPAALFREFLRRIAFAHLRLATALALDATAAAFTIASLAVLAAFDALSAATALAAFGVSCAASVLLCLPLARNCFALSPRGLRDAATRSWRMGTWIGVSQIAAQMQGYVPYWLSAALSGTALTGLFAASMSIVSLANPVVFGYWNIALSRMAHELRDGGAIALRRQARRDAALLIVLMAAFCGGLVLFGPVLLGALYGRFGDPSAAQLLSLLSVAALAGAAGMPASAALAAAGRVRAVAMVSAAGAAFAALCVWLALPAYGLVGVAYACLAAELAGSLARWLAFLALVPTPAVSLADAARTPA